jgi:SlyX protein
MDTRMQRLEEKIAYLERHVVAQDRAMLELTEQVARLRQALTALRERLPDSPTGGEAAPEDERPPHY